MRSLVAGTVLLCLAAPAMAQMRSDDAAAAHGWPSRNGDAAVEGQRWYKKAAAGFGDCVVAHDAAEAQSFAEAASRKAKTIKSPQLRAAIKACLYEHQRAGQFSNEQQNAAIYHAVLRSNGKRAPS